MTSNQRANAKEAVVMYAQIDTLKEIDGYAPPAERPPLLPYAGAMAAFNALFALALLLARRSGRELPERVGAADLATIGVASHKVSRLIAKDKVTSPLRAPFT